MHAWVQDFRYAVRTLLKMPGLTAVMVLSLAIGIGANSTIFSVVDALLLRPLPYPEPGRLAAVWIHSPGQYSDLLAGNQSFEEISISRLTSWTLTGLEQPQRVEGMRTSSNLLRMLGAKPLLGRLLLPEEDAPGKPPVAILTYGLWTRLFSAD